VLEPVLFHHQHLDELLAPDRPRAQTLGLLVSQLAQRRLSPLAIKRQYPRVNLVGLRQPTDALGELAHPAGIDDDHWKLGRAQGRDQHALIGTALDQYSRAAC